MDTQKKSLFPGLRKKYQFFKYPSGSALKSGRSCLKLSWIGNVSLKYKNKPNQQSTIIALDQCRQE